MSCNVPFYFSFEQIVRGKIRFSIGRTEDEMNGSMHAWPAPNAERENPFRLIKPSGDENGFKLYK